MGPDENKPPLDNQPQKPEADASEPVVNVNASSSNPVNTTVPEQAPIVNQPAENQQSDISAPQTPSIEPPLPANNKKSKSKLLIVAVILIIVIVGAALITGFVTNNKSVKGKKYDIPLIRYAINDNPLNSFYPEPQSNEGAVMIQPQIYEGLVSFQNGTQIKPSLALSWKNPNDTTWVFKLNPNVYYHDGDKVTAQDVVDTWKQISQNDAYSSYVTNTISNVKALSPTSVEIDTSQPDALLLNRLALMYIVDSKAPKGTAQWQLGTGAYTVKPGTKPSANNLDLVAFKKWHGGHIYTHEVQYTFVADPDQELKSLLSNKVDLIDYLSTDSVSNSIKQNFHVFTSPQIGTNIVGFNTTNQKSPVANIKIRQAMNLAVNGTEVLNNSNQQGLPINQLIPQSIPGYNPDIHKTLDIAEAANLVKQAGYPSGVTINLEVGEPVKAVAQEIAKEVKPAGINIVMNVVNSEQTFIDDYNNGNFEAIVDGATSSLVDGSDILGSLQDQAFYTNPTVDAQLKTADQTFDAATRLKNLQQAELTYYKDYGYVPLYQLSILSASKKDMVFPLGDYDQDLNAYFAAVYSTSKTN